MSNPSDFAADYLLDRRRLRRRLTFWRAAAVIAVIAIVALVAWGRGGFLRGGALTPQIARITSGGVITGDRDTIKLVDDVAASRASAVILAIDSPGGTTTGAEKLYDAIRRLAAKKPVVSVVGTMAASGAYIAALGSDRIFARGNSLVGSIGVLFEYPNVSKLLDTIGVHMESVKSSPLKAAPNGLEPTSPEARAALAALVADAFDWFKSLVRERRGMDDAQLAAVSDGRVFSGRQGVPLKLVDAIGGEREAIEWLEQNRGVAKGLPVRDWRRGGGLGRLGLLGFAALAADSLGLSGVAANMENIEKIQQLRSLDGLLAVWQGPLVD